MRFFREQARDPFQKLGLDLQYQPYDEAVEREERIETAFESLVADVARNPDGQKHAPTDGFLAYKYTGCLIPSDPELRLWDSDYWIRFWRTYSFLCLNGLVRRAGKDETPP